MLLYCPSAQNARHNACLAAKPHAGLMCSLGIDLQGLASMLQCCLLDLTGASAAIAQAAISDALAARTAAK